MEQTLGNTVPFTQLPHPCAESRRPVPSLPLAARRRRFMGLSRQLVIVVSILAGLLCAVVVCLAGNFSSILLNQIRDAYILYRVTNERDALRVSLRQMEEEVVSLRLARSNDRILESQLTSKVDALKEVVSLAGSLGLVNRIEERGAVGQRAVQSDRGKVERSELRELARSLSKEKGATHESLPERLADLRSLNRGLGGAEVECRRGKSGKVVCDSPASKEDVSFEQRSTSDDHASVQQSLSTLALGTTLSEDERIKAIQALSQITKALRILPIGSPVSGSLTSGYGHRHSPFSHSTSFHEGVDISLARGGAVLATADGVVTKVDFDGTYGWVVDIEHTPELITRYAHLSRPLVKEGAQVSRGDKIALSGSSGRSTGPHLHYEIRYRNVARNPKPFLALADKLHRFSFS